MIEYDVFYADDFLTNIWITKVCNILDYLLCLKSRKKDRDRYLKICKFFVMKIFQVNLVKIMMLIKLSKRGKTRVFNPIIDSLTSFISFFVPSLMNSINFYKKQTKKPQITVRHIFWYMPNSFTLWNLGFFHFVVFTNCVALYYSKQYQEWYFNLVNSSSIFR